MLFSFLVFRSIRLDYLEVDFDHDSFGQESFVAYRFLLSVVSFLFSNTQAHSLTLQLSDSFVTVTWLSQLSLPLMTELLSHSC